MPPSSRLLIAVVLLLSTSGLVRSQVPLATCKQPSAVTAIAFAPDGKSIAAGSNDSTIYLWDPATQKEQKQIKGMQQRVTAVLITPDGKSLVAGSQLGMVSVWDLPQQQQRMASHSGRGSAMALALSPDGQNLVSGGEDRRMFVREVATGRFHRIIHGHTGKINAISYCSDGRHFASAAADKTCRIWDSTNGQEVRKLDTNEATGFQSVAYSPDGKKLVTGTKDLIQIWDPATGKELAKMPGHKGLVNALAFSKDGKMLASVGEDGDVQVWDPASGRLMRRLGRHNKAANALAFAPDGKTLATGGEDNQLLIWDVSPRIFLPPKPVDLNDKELLGLWDTLAGNDFAKASEAVGTMAASKQSIGFLADRLKKARPDEDEKVITKLITDLDDDQFAVREKAQAKLELLGPVAGPHVELALKRDVSLEARRRGERILERLKTPQLTPDQQRLQRAVAVLELNNSADSRKILEDLARGAGGAWLALEAQSSLERLKK